MAKYVRYQVVADFGEYTEDFENYRQAFSEFHKKVRYGSAATLYGISLEEEFSVILSSGGKTR